MKYITEATWDARRKPFAVANVIADVIFIYYLNKLEELSKTQTRRQHAPIS